MIIKTLAHVCIKTTNLDQTRDFYCEALGMEMAFNFVRKGEVIGFYIIASPNSFIEVFLTDRIEPIGGNHVLSHFCLQTESLEDLRQRILEKGYFPRAITMGSDNTSQFWVTDPNGLDIEFQQYTDQSSQLIGKDVEVNW